MHRVLAALPAPWVASDWAPTFLIGCGRSGTTILGELFGSHPDVVYLNEPRYLWRAVDPRTDVWSPNPHRRGARLRMDENDADPIRCARYRRVFWYRARLSGRRRLLEKTPVNVFRLRLIRHVFPKAHYLVIHRHPLDVARSMARQPGWFSSHGAFRWCQLRELALADGFEADWLDGVQTDLERGIVEWTLAIGAIERDRPDGESGRVVTVRYEDLLRDSRGHLERLARHMGLEPNPRWSSQASARLLAPKPGAGPWPSRWHPRTLERMHRLGYAPDGSTQDVSEGA
ncbi:MAG: sulfotransferase [Myxococcota bacterium]|nr:sulfotransferase [Myxococcota bacterium]MDW8361129.1 sulfotransferase [Myxococcales bacterium]